VFSRVGNGPECLAGLVDIQSVSKVDKGPERLAGSVEVRIV
jgi:hypothetical protein